MRPDWPHHTRHWRKTLFKLKTVRLLEMGLRVNFKRIFVLATLMGWRAVNSYSMCTFTKHCRRFKWLFIGVDRETGPKLQSNVCFFPTWTYCCPEWWEIFAESCDWHWAAHTAPVLSGRSDWSLPQSHHCHQHCLTQSSLTLTGYLLSPPLQYKIHCD